MIRLPGFALAFAVLPSIAIAQAASISTITTSCTTPNGTPTIHHQGLPQLGNQNFSISYTGPNMLGTLMLRPYLVIGFNVISPSPIPTTMFPAQPANCILLARHDIVWAAPEGHGTYIDLLTLPIPNSPALNGGVFYAQWITVHTQCGIVPPCWNDWVATSDTLACTIGV
ncbi:MAG: hypothetical protein KDB80_10805 [Planctomycetes bacterium]|nr:hypothetical protein [Planctomycetota bacterium]